MKHALVVVALLANALVGCKGDKTGAAKEEADNGGRKIKITQRLTRRLAYEAYPTWSMQNPDKPCPEKVDELVTALVTLMDDKTGTIVNKDPWGHELKMFCGPTLPADARGLAIQSAGPDGKLDTADDIKSWPM